MWGNSLRPFAMLMGHMKLSRHLTSVSHFQGKTFGRVDLTSQQCSIQDLEVKLCILTKGTGPSPIL